jgi:hypothetical protein
LASTASLIARAAGRGVEDAVGRDQRGHEPGAALEHQGDRLVVEVDAVLDRADARPHRVLDAVGGLGVGHDVEPGRRRLLDQHLELFQAEVRGVGPAARREHAPRGRHLDDVGPVADHLAHLAAHLVGRVDDRVGQPGVAREQLQEVARRHPAVAVAAGLRDHRQRDLHPRTADEAVLERPLEPQVGAAGVADGGDADGQRRLEVGDRLVEAVGERRLGHPPDVDVAQHDVDVAVEQPGQERRARHVDRLVAVEPGPDVDDAPLLDGHVAVGEGGAGAVEHPAPGEDGAHGLQLRGQSTR